VIDDGTDILVIDFPVCQGEVRHLRYPII